MSKTYLIETRQTFIIGYVVTMDDDMDPKEISKQVIASEQPTEFYQLHIGEEFDQCIPLKKGQAPRVFRSKNGYLADLSDEVIVSKFVMDFRTKKGK